MSSASPQLRPAASAPAHNPSACGRAISSAAILAAGFCASSPSILRHLAGVNHGRPRAPATWVRCDPRPNPATAPRLGRCPATASSPVAHCQGWLAHSQQLPKPSLLRRRFPGSSRHTRAESRHDLRGAGACIATAHGSPLRHSRRQLLRCPVCIDLSAIPAGRRLTLRWSSVVRILLAAPRIPVPNGLEACSHCQHSCVVLPIPAQMS